MKHIVYYCCNNHIKRNYIEILKKDKRRPDPVNRLCGHRVKQPPDSYMPQRASMLIYCNNSRFIANYRD